LVKTAARAHTLNVSVEALFRFPVEKPSVTVHLGSCFEVSGYILQVVDAFQNIVIETKMQLSGGNLDVNLNFIL